MTKMRSVIALQSFFAQLGLISLFQCVLPVTITAELVALWNFQDTVVPTNLAANITAANVTISSGSISYQNGTDDGGTRIGNSGSWNQSEFSTEGKYLQISITPNSGYELHLTNVTIRLGRTDAGPTKFTAQYSMDGFASAGTSAGSGDISSEIANSLDPFTVSTPSDFQSGTITYRIWGHDAAGTGNLRFNNFRVFGSVSLAPTITLSTDALSSFTTDEGYPSANQQFTVEGENLRGNLTVDAPAGFHVSTDSSSGFGASLVLTETGGTVDKTTIYIRLTGIGEGNYSGNIEVSGGGAAPQTKAATGTVNPLSAPTANAATAIGVTNFTANWTTVVGATGYRIDVSTNGSFVGASTTAVGWDFDDDELTATTGLAVNLNQELSNVGAGAIGSITRSTGNLAASANGWDSGDGVKYWQVSFDASGVAQLTVSSVQRSSGTGPRDFKLQYRIGVAGTWIDVAGGTVQTANDYTSGVLSNAPLPAAADNQPAVYLRWIMTSNTSVDNGTVGGSGTSAIDDIIIAGNMLDFILGYANRAVPGQATDSLVVTGLVSNTEHHYRVRATSDTSTSAHSGKQSTTTLVIPSPTLEEASSVESDRFAANWSAVLEADGYLLDVSTNSQFTTFLDGFENRDVGFVTSHTVTGLWANTLYYYRLRAYDAGSASANSSTQTVTTSIKPEPTNHPTGFTASAVTHRTIMLQWEDSVDGVLPDGYLIRGSTHSFDAIPIPVDKVNVPNDATWSGGLYAWKAGAGVETLVLTGLSAVQDYYFRIYPYANQYSNIDYKTDGTVLSLAVTTDVAPWEDMEDASKLGYATGTVDLKTGTWLFDDALLGIDASDKRRDQRAARIRNEGIIEMQFDVSEIGFLTLEHAMYGTDAGGAFQLDVSIDGGTNWTKVGDSVYSTSSLKRATFRIQRRGTLRIRVVKTQAKNDANRINIDNINFGPFVYEPSVFRFR